jgi:hypothetical protein
MKDLTFCDTPLENIRRFVYVEFNPRILFQKAEMFPFK